ncbi:hypothetical protein [Bartonella sp. B1098]|uniref:hypothetical protein n=1 Tax=Bartonella sp. B1098 TaxID=2911421 RepID=UPI0020C4215B|nr:hypothetical protein [Bartonella sp. B1098]
MWGQVNRSCYRQFSLQISLKMVKRKNVYLQKDKGRLSRGGLMYCASFGVWFGLVA